MNCDALKTINYAGTKEEWRQVNHCAIPERVEIVYGKENVKTDVIQSGTCGENLTWTLSGSESRMTLTISGTGEMDDFEYSYKVPWSKYVGVIGVVAIEEGVTSIGNNAFYGCSGLTNITIPEGVTSIGDHAFSGCSRLTSITIPEGVTSIGVWAFYDCKSLTSITIPETMSSIGKCAFNWCRNIKEVHIDNIETWLNMEVSEGNDELSSWKVYLNNEPLKKVVIPEGVTAIRTAAFKGCSSLTSITIPEGVKKIGASAFSGCSNLRSITIPEGVTSIGDNAFNSCSRLTSITIPETVSRIGEHAFKLCGNIKEVHIDNIETWLNMKVGIGNVELSRVIIYLNNEPLTNVVIPEGVTAIRASAFEGCSGLTSITIPEGVTSIGNNAFEGCSGLTSITIPEGVTSIGNNAFYGCSGLTSITIPKGVTSIGVEAFYYCRCLTSITIPEGVTSIGDHAFYGCRGLTSITIPKGVTSIGVGAFYYCSGLTSITIPEGVTSIEGWTFYCCSGLTSITIPKGVTSIGVGAFYFCSGLTCITIPEGVTSIGDRAFDGCSRLTSITIPEGVTSIGASAFDGCSRLTSITIPEGVTSIGDQAFEGCRDLTSITIPEGVTSIGDRAFDGCSRLTSITIPEGVTSIGNNAFDGCSGLTSITIPEGVTSIGDNAFNGCSRLTSITIPEGVTSIGASAFNGCSGLTSITIPEGVTSIGDHAFEGCSSLTSITIPEGVTSIGASAFNSCSSLTSITIPEGVTSIGDHAFEGCSRLTSIMIPEGVTSIGQYTFYGCSSLTSISLPEGLTNIGNHAFESCKNLANIYIPYSTKAINKDAFSGYTGKIKYWGTSDEWNSIYEGDRQAELISVSLNSENLTFGINQIAPLILTSNFDDIGVGNIIWSSSDDEIASVDDTGIVTAHKLGEAVITATTEWGNHSASCVVKVVVLTKGVQLDKDSLSLYHGDSEELTATIEPENAENLTVTWASSDPEIVSVDENGHLEALKVGTATVTVTTEEGNHTASCEVTVEHEWDQDHTIDKEPTCTENGSKSIHCKRCEEKKDSEEISATGHSFTHYVPNLKSGTKSAECDHGCGTVNTIEIPQETSGTCGSNLSWKLYENSVLYISGSGSMEEYDSNKPAPWATLSVKSCVIENGVTSIGGSAFENCGELESVELANSVTSIGSYAFYNCADLKSFSMSNRISSIGNNAFEKCGSLEGLNFTSTPPTFGKNAFKGCSDLTISGFEGTAAESVAEEYGLTFKSLGMKGSCGTSANYLFTKADGSLVISGSGQIQNYLVDTKTGKSSTPWSDENVRSISIGSSITQIGEGAFAGCGSVSDITIPYRVTSLGKYAFMGCTSLESVDFKNYITNIPEGAFKGCSSLRNINLTSGMKEIQTSAFEDCSSLTDVTIPNSVIKIGDYAFAGTGISSITLPSKLAEIGECAFRGTMLSTIEIPAETTSVIPTAFEECESLESILVDDSNNNYASSAGILTSKDGTVIIKCPAAKTGAYTTSHSLVEIKSDAFKGCKYITEINLSEGLEVIGDNAFSGMTITEIEIPSTVNSIGNGAFTNCSNLEAIDVDEENEYFASVEGVLYNKERTKLIVCPSSKDGSFEVSEDITEISDNAFAYNNGLDEVTIPYYVDSIGNNAFIGSDITIKGYDNSYAKKYAESNGLPFESMGNYCIKEAVVGDTINAYELIGNNLSDEEISGWKSSNPEIANVDEDGIVTAISDGMARISIDAAGYTGSCAIYVYKHWGYDIIFDANGGTGNMDSMRNLNLNETYELSRNMFTRYGYIFDSWVCRDAKGNTIELDDCDRVLGLAGEGESVTLTARWTETNTKVYISEGELSTSGIENYEYILNPRTNYLIYSYSLTGNGKYRSNSYSDVESAPESLNLGKLEAGTYNLTWATRSYTVEQTNARLVRDSQGNYTYRYTYEYHWGSNTSTNKTTIYVRPASSVVIQPVSITEASVDEIKSTYPQTGTAITPVSAIRYNGVKLLEGRDYTLEYKNNTAVGHASAVIKGQGKYTGTVTVDFWIVDKEGDKVSLFNDKTVIKGLDNCVFNGKAHLPTGIVVTIDGLTLEKNKDYTVSYGDNVNAGKGNVLIKGIGIYTDTIEAEFDILPKSIFLANVSEIPDVRYTGTGIEQKLSVTSDEVLLVKDKDYTVTYYNNVRAGTAEIVIDGIGNYTGSIKRTFKISLDTPVIAKLTNADGGVTVTWGKVPGASKYCVLRKLGSGKWTKLAVVSGASYTDKTVVSGKKYSYTIGCVASDGKTYVSEYSAVGKAITYVAKPVLSSVENVSNGIKLTWKKVPGAVKYRVFRKGGKGAWTKLVDTTALTYLNKGVKAGTQYAYTVRCITKDGKQYTSAYDTKGRICVFVARPTLSTIKSAKAKQLTVNWKKAASVTGYQIQYSTSKTFKSGNKAVTVKGASSVTKTISKLSSKKRYYVRIRSYKTVGGKNYYSAWSAVKNAVIK